jgi:hypothetical protein
LALRSVSEVPLALFGYGAELITHLLLLMTLAASAGDSRIRQAQNSAGLKHAPVKPARDTLAPAKFSP